MGLVAGRREADGGGARGDSALYGLLVSGVILVGVTGLFTWAQMDYNLITSRWPLAQEVL